MPRVIVTEGAAIGLERCRRFLEAKSAEAAQKAAKQINRQFRLLATQPDIGRPMQRTPELRELSIPFGNSGYVALYRHEIPRDTVYILAFRHQREAGY
ncbi:type II toxin-antitoxin system RelE/ParE family toxin [Rhizobium glycinendophyticum]|uniref:Type II toxin-antitoxin system RelE/ParE family toxin n=1 Tax=Rhizobium glycinendophyticum TaxID=2589807 RepID=A0A504TVV6_9HYPH|nr:type II toxin-antitoxin system RelE/ParE family toxin [Rhizobium glycinendophyticum]TPP06614.1 type II toxin-antitoxin system RelE/ParE family toxin [Rhizobium glycinendophyticum]